MLVVAALAVQGCAASRHRVELGSECDGKFNSDNHWRPTRTVPDPVRKLPIAEASGTPRRDADLQRTQRWYVQDDGRAYGLCAFDACGVDDCYWNTWIIWVNEEPPRVEDFGGLAVYYSQP